jgi:predicted nuclease of predicted toxin-antitoxin system
MKVYLDDNLVAKSLGAMLTKGGHHVVRSNDVGLSGATDPKHLAHAIRTGLVALTSDWQDFEDLHELVLAAGGTHPGIVVVRFDNDPTRDLKPKQIVKALGKLERSGAPLLNQLIVLNQWR